MLEGPLAMWSRWRPSVHAFCRFAPPSDGLEKFVNTHSEVVRVLDTVLSLGGRAQRFTRDTPLLGAIPELDSMAVVSLLTTLEERFGFVIEDDEIDSQTFATLGNLVQFVESKVAA